jgi:hypothetical protein
MEQDPAKGKTTSVCVLFSPHGNGKSNEEWVLCEALFSLTQTLLLCLYALCLLVVDDFRVGLVRCLFSFVTLAFDTCTHTHTITTTTTITHILKIILHKPSNHSTFQSGELPVPPPVKEIYNRLFWYGFDPADSDGGVADKTVFGGTKGKFNGLEFLKDGQEALWQAERNRTPRNSSGGSTTPPRRRLPPPANTNPTFRTDDRRNGYYDTTRNEEENDTFSEDDNGDSYDNEDDEYYDTTKPSAQVPFRPSPIKPPEEKPYPRRDPPIAQRQRRQRQSPQGSYFEGADYDVEDETQADYGSRRRQRQRQRQGSETGDWVAKQVSSWFGGGEDSNRMNPDEPMDDESNVGRRRRRRQQDSEWSPMNVINTFLGVDREKMANQAELYNQNMGLGGATRGSRPGRSNNRRTESAGSRSGESSQRRPGYAYRYNPEDEEETGKIDPAATAYDVEAEPDVEGVRGATRTTRKEGEKDVAEPLRERERSWEERQLAVERIPPNVVAWGPSGEIGMDARTKAILDALEDVQTARQKVDIKEKKEVLAREDITILKV